MTNRPKAVCKDCKRRNPGCHSNCQDYISFKKELEDYHIKLKEDKRLSAEWSEYTRKRICRR